VLPLPNCQQQGDPEDEPEPVRSGGGFAVLGRTGRADDGQENGACAGDPDQPPEREHDAVRLGLGVMSISIIATIGRGLMASPAAPSFADGLIIRGCLRGRSSLPASGSAMAATHALARPRGSPSWVDQGRCVTELPDRSYVLIVASIAIPSRLASPA
jgi:hypothetical protein